MLHTFCLFCNSRDCSLYNITTNVIDSGKYVVFSSDLGGYTNPLTIDYGFGDWKKVNIIHAATTGFSTTPQVNRGN